TAGAAIPPIPTGDRTAARRPPPRSPAPPRRRARAPAGRTRGTARSRARRPPCDRRCAGGSAPREHLRMPPTRTDRVPSSACPARPADRGRRTWKPAVSTRRLRAPLVGPLLLPHVHAEPRRIVHRHRYRVPLLAELGMTEQDFMRPDPDRQVADRR